MFTFISEPHLSCFDIAESSVKKEILRSLFGSGEETNTSPSCGLLCKQLYLWVSKVDFSIKYQQKLQVISLSIWSLLPRKNERDTVFTSLFIYMVFSCRKTRDFKGRTVSCMPPLERKWKKKNKTVTEWSIWTNLMMEKMSDFYR